MILQSKRNQIRFDHPNYHYFRTKRLNELTIKHIWQNTSTQNTLILINFLEKIDPRHWSDYKTSLKPIKMHLQAS